MQLPFSCLHWFSIYINTILTMTHTHTLHTLKNKKHTHTHTQSYRHNRESNRQRLWDGEEDLVIEGSEQRVLAMEIFFLENKEDEFSCMGCGWCYFQDCLCGGSHCSCVHPLLLLPLLWLSHLNFLYFFLISQFFFSFSKGKKGVVMNSFLP